MGRMPRLVERGKKDRRLGEPSEVSWEEIEALELDPRVELIRPGSGTLKAARRSCGGARSTSWFRSSTVDLASRPRIGSMRTRSPKGRAGTCW